MLRVENIRVEYPSKKWRKPGFVALNGVSLDVQAGETVGIVGESGSGKTTLGRAVLGLAPVTAGSIVYDGREISSMTPSIRSS